MHAECAQSKMTLWRKWGQSQFSASHPIRWLPLSNKIWLVFPKPLPPIRGALTVCLMDFFQGENELIHRKAGPSTQWEPSDLSCYYSPQGAESDQARCCSMSKKWFSSIWRSTIAIIWSSASRTQSPEQGWGVWALRSDSGDPLRAPLRLPVW